MLANMEKVGVVHPNLEVKEYVESQLSIHYWQWKAREYRHIIKVQYNEWIFRVENIHLGGCTLISITKGRLIDRFIYVVDGKARFVTIVSSTVIDIRVWGTKRCCDVDEVIIEWSKYLNGRPGNMEQHLLLSETVLSVWREQRKPPIWTIMTNPQVVRTFIDSMHRGEHPLPQK